MSNRVQSARGNGKLRWLAGRLRAHTAAELGLLALTLLALLAARAGLAVIPVKRLLSEKQRAVRRKPVADVDGLIQTVRWAVQVVVRRAPIRFVCFPQCLAGSWLLRRSGVESLLHYGVARSGGRLETHTWLEARGVVLLGGEERERFEEIAVY